MVNMLKLKKKGQAAAAAATFLAILAGLLVVFVILVSPEDRDALLNDGVTDGGIEDSTTDNVEEKILLEEYPGKVDYLSLDEVEHSLAAVRIYTNTESVTLKEKDSVYTKNGIFSEDVGEFSFSISDLDNTDSVVFSFAINDGQGNLAIIFNEEELYNSPITVGDSPIITVPDNLIAEDNVITFQVSSPGIAFWKTNFASLINLKVVGRYTDLGYQSASNTFLVSETEYDNLESLELQFQPDCDYDEVGRLIISINDYNIYSGVPDCGLSMVPIEFSPEVVYQGENQITFYTEYEEYELSHIKIMSQLEEIDYTTYYFELSHEEEESVQDEDSYVELTLEFTDDTSEKTGYVSINGDRNHFDTREISYAIDISDDIVSGNNAVQINPSTTIELRELVVELKED
jgi:hypothetical protein